MIIVMKPDAGEEKLSAVVERVKELGLSPHLIDGEERTIVGVVGLPLPPTLDELFELLPGVDQVVRISTKFKLTGWD
jgi:3-deoxy-7-phosphoheptulonate synthase